MKLARLVYSTSLPRQRIPSSFRFNWFSFSNSSSGNISALFVTRWQILTYRICDEQNWLGRYCDEVESSKISLKQAVCKRDTVLQLERPYLRQHCFHKEQKRAVHGLNRIRRVCNSRQLDHHDLFNVLTVPMIDLNDTQETLSQIAFILCLEVAHGTTKKTSIH